MARIDLIGPRHFFLNNQMVGFRARIDDVGLFVHVPVAEKLLRQIDAERLGLPRGNGDTCNDAKEE
jgi:hypothetical protein